MTVISDSSQKGIVFNIQKYSVHDGEGIRTIVFLKGCPLRCLWCSNPESQEIRPELAQNTGRCLGTAKCGYCLSACPAKALSPSEVGGPPHLDREKCTGCLSCTQMCPSKALTPYGKELSVKEVVNTVEQDNVFYARSGGGMTISGGEPFMQSDFSLALLRETKKHRINTAAETCGMVPWEVLKEGARYLDEILFDIKSVDSAKHKKATGVGNERILSNFIKLMETYPKLPTLVRTPVIPGVNDTSEDIQRIVDFLKPFPHVRYELLAYHRLGTQKYTFLDREYPLGDVTLNTTLFAKLEQLARNRQSHCEMAL